MRLLDNGGDSPTGRPGGGIRSCSELLLEISWERFNERDGLRGVRLRGVSSSSVSDVRAVLVDDWAYVESVTERADGVRGEGGLEIE